MTRSRTALVALALSAALVPTQAQESQPAPQPEHIPPHALQRLGSWTQRQRRPVTCVAFAHEGRSVLTACDDGTTSLWDIASAQRIRQFVGHEEGVKCVTVAPNGKTIATAGWEGSVRLWDLETGGSLAIYRGHTQGVSSVAFSPDGSRLASGGSDATVRVWSLSTGTQEHQFKVAGGRPVSVAFSPDGTILAAGGTDAAISLWSMPSGQPLAVLKDDTGWVLHIAFSPDGRRLASGGNGGTIIVWDVASQQEIQRFQERAEVLSAAWSRDGKTLASGTYDGGVQLWELATGQRVWSRIGHVSGVLSVAFAADGMTVASGSTDTTALVWDVSELRTLGENPRRELSPDTLEACWRELGDPTASVGQRAVWLLVADPKASVPWLASRSQAPAPADQARVRRLIQDLNSDRFLQREQAMAELERLDEQAVPHLKQELLQEPAPEARRRIAQLLGRMDRPVAPPPRLRLLRSIQVLEQIGSKEAVDVLARLAQSDAQTTVSREASAAEARMKQRLGRE
jgi:tricorn protease-like protein